MKQPRHAPPTKLRRPWRWLGLAVVLAAGVALGVSYLERRILARELVTGWLRQQGVESEIAFKAFGPNGLSGTLRIGPADDPDLTADLVQVQYGLPMFWSGKSIHVTAIRLIHPRLKGRWHDGRLSLGSLDPLVQRLLKLAPDPTWQPPEIILEDGTLRLTTDYGPIVAKASGQFRKGKLDRLDLIIDPTSLKGSSFQAKVGRSELHLVRFGDRLAVAAETQSPATQFTTVSTQAALLRLTGQIPYPDLVRKTANGDVSLKLISTAQSVASRPVATKSVQFDEFNQEINFQGSATGTLERLDVRGSGDLVTQARTGGSGAIHGEDISNRTQATNLIWTRAGGDVFGADLMTQSSARTLATRTDGRLERLSLMLQGPIQFSKNGLMLNFTGSARAKGGWRGLGSPTPGDTPADAGLKRALAAVRISAPGVKVGLQGSDLTLTLSSPLQMRPDTGGLAEVRGLRGPLYAQGGGSFAVTTAGGGLPSTALTVSRYQQTGRNITGQLSLTTKGSFGPVEAGAADVSGAFQLGPRSLTLVADRCAAISIGRLELGANDLEVISGKLCPTQRPLFRTGAGALQVNGVLKDVAAQIPFLEAKVSEVSGPLLAEARNGSLALSTQITASRLTDTSQATRFRPLRAQGMAQLKSQFWRGDFTLSDLGGRALAEAKLSHDGTTGIGTLLLDTGDLAFADGGLQPAALSPLASMVGSPAQGHVQFQGAVDWAKNDSTSHGMLIVKSLDFRSPAGAVKGLSGRVVLTSLAPLRAAPGQLLHAEGFAGLAAVGASDVSFGLDEKAIQVSGATLALGGGTLTLRPFEIPFARDASWNGVADLAGVQVADLVEASPFGDRMDLVAKVSGEIPFSISPQGMRINGGQLRAIEPGRLSIRREALTQVASDTGTPVQKDTNLDTSDPLSDFVYQAMENLDFSALDAKVDSLSEGRLGIVFHIKGEHNPPTRTSPDIRLSWREVVGRKITQKIPLPSGTKVDLTLDTSVNLDQLLADFADYQKARGSGPVQP